LLYSLSVIAPVKIYSNPLEQKYEIFQENKGSAGIYLWENKINGDCYVGSSIDLGKRLRDYYKIDLLTNKRANSYIHRAILAHGYLNFTLKILEYCDRGDTFTREQYYLDLLKPEYNIQKLAGFYLGYKHPDEVRKQMSESKKGEKNSFYGKSHTEEVKALMSTARKNRLTQPKPGLQVEVIDLETNVTTVYDSVRKAADALNSDIKTILRREKNGITKPPPLPRPFYFIYIYMMYIKKKEIGLVRPLFTFYMYLHVKRKKTEENRYIINIKRG